MVKMYTLQQATAYVPDLTHWCMNLKRGSSMKNSSTVACFTNAVRATASAGLKKTRMETWFVDSIFQPISMAFKWTLTCKARISHHWIRFLRAPAKVQTLSMESYSSGGIIQPWCITCQSYFSSGVPILRADPYSPISKSCATCSSTWWKMSPTVHHLEQCAKQWW